MDKGKPFDWKEKVILITGGTGSFGNAFVEAVLRRQRPKKLIIFSRDEMKQDEMKRRIKDPENRLRYFIGDVRDCERLHRAFQGVDIVVHAAAMKIVPSTEYNPFEAVKTNVIGAENVINMAIDNGVERVIALSTDKAANPINLYGATKLCAEKMFIAGNYYSNEGARFSVVRYGNVFGSRGSVVPVFRASREKGVVPITDARMTRFWITLKQGVVFVIRCLEEMVGGEIFVPKLPSLRIVDLAEVVCPGCRHEVVGIRPGEKVHETLVCRDEGPFAYEYEDRFVICPPVALTRFEQKGKKPLGPSFNGYTSDTNPRWLNVEQLKDLVDREEPPDSRPRKVLKAATTKSE